MLKMSFFNGNLNKEKAIKFIQETKKPCVFTAGFKYKNPTIYEVYITKEEAIEKIKTESFLEIKEYENKVDLNAFSSNDMF